MIILLHKANKNKSKVCVTSMYTTQHVDVERISLIVQCTLLLFTESLFDTLNHNPNARFCLYRHVYILCMSMRMISRCHCGDVRIETDFKSTESHLYRVPNSLHIYRKIAFALII